MLLRPLGAVVEGLLVGLRHLRRDVLRQLDSPSRVQIQRLRAQVLIDLLGTAVQMEVDLVLVHRGVQRRVQHHRPRVLLVVVRRVVVVVVVGVSRVGAPVVRVVSTVVGVPRARADHGVDLGFGTVEHGRRGGQRCIDKLVMAGLR